LFSLKRHVQFASINLPVASEPTYFWKLCIYTVLMKQLWA